VADNKLDIGNDNKSVSDNRDKHDIICDICGKQFDNEKSLRGHMIRAHRGGRKPQGDVYSSTSTGEVPDALGLLRNQLITYGVTPRDADAVVDYMKSYNVDDLEALSRALTDIGMPLNKKRLFFTSWIRLRGLSPTPEQARRLGIYENTIAQTYPSLMPFRSETAVGFGEILEGVAKLLQILRTEQPSNNGGDKLLLQNLLEENRTLTAKIEELKNELMKREIESLKLEIQRLKESGEADATIKFLDKRFDALEKKTSELVNVLKPIVRVFGERVLNNYAGGYVDIQPSPEPPRIAEILPSDYVVEEVEEVDGK